jgi:hypothetical protein
MEDLLPPLQVLDVMPRVQVLRLHLWCRLEVR